MKKALTALLISVLILFTSCDLTTRFEKPELYLITVGVSYVNTPYRLSNTQYDEEAMRMLFTGLADQAGMKWHSLSYTDRYEPKDRTVYLDLIMRNSEDGHRADEPGLATRLRGRAEDYTSTQIIDTISRTINRTCEPKPNDIMIFYFAGHGFESGNPWLAPGQPIEDLEGKENREASLTMSQLLGQNGFFDGFNCRKVLLLDSCFSGKAINGDRDSINGGNIMGGDGWLDQDNPYQSKMDKPPKSGDDGDERAARNIIQGAGDAENGADRPNRNDGNNQTEAELKSDYCPIPNVFIITAAGPQQEAADGGYLGNSPFVKSIIGTVQPGFEPGDHVHFGGRKLILSDLYRHLLKDLRAVKDQDPQTILTRYDVVLFDFRQ